MFKKYAINAAMYSSISLASLFSVSGPIEQFKNYLGTTYLQTKESIVAKIAESQGYAKPIDQKTWKSLADQYARASGLNSCLVRAVIKVESDNCTKLVSSAGAMGCMQLMPATAKSLGIVNDAQRLDAEINIHGGTSHLKTLIAQHGLFMGLKIYNAGPLRVDATAENREYPHKIFAELVKCKDEVID